MGFNRSRRIFRESRFPPPPSWRNSGGHGTVPCRLRGLEAHRRYWPRLCPAGQSSNSPRLGSRRRNPIRRLSVWSPWTSQAERGSRFDARGHQSGDETGDTADDEARGRRLQQK